MTGTCAGISQALAHRYPMLLIDRVVEMVPGQRVVALKAVTCNEPWYQDPPAGSAPEDHDYPAVLVAESWCQAAALLASHRSAQLGAQGGLLPLFGAISDVVFTARVRPGDVLEHRVRQVRAVADTVIFEGESLAGGTPVLTVGQLMIAWRPAAQVTAAGPGAGRPAARPGTSLVTGHV